MKILKIPVMSRMSIHMEERRRITRENGIGYRVYFKSPLE